MDKNQTGLTPAQIKTLTAHISSWLNWCAQNDSDFDPSYYEIHVYKRPSGVADLFYKGVDCPIFGLMPHFQLGYVYPNGQYVDTEDYDSEMNFYSYLENVTRVQVTLPAAFGLAAA